MEKNNHNAKKRVIDSLLKDDREKVINDILDLYYRQGLSLRQIANKYNCSRQNIYSIIKRYKFKIGKKIDDIIKDPKPFIQDSWDRLNRMIERLERDLKDLENPRDIINTISEIRNLEIAKYELLNQLGWRPKMEVEKISRIIFEVKEDENK